MSGKNRKDNINKGDEHGQESFESAGVLLPKISKEQYDNELDSFERIPKSFDEIDKKEIVSMGYEIYNRSLKNKKENVAFNVFKAFAEMKGLLGVKRESGEEQENNKSIKLEIIGVKSSNSNT